MDILQGETRIRGAQGPGERLVAVAAALATRFETYAQTHGRLGRIRRLQAKSDAELAAMGLTRDRIVHHVYRDKLGF